MPHTNSSSSSEELNQEEVVQEEEVARAAEEIARQAVENIFTQYNKAISENASDKAAAKTAFVASYTTDKGAELSVENKKKAEAAFDAMYSFYNGKKAEKVKGGKDSKEEYAITQHSTAWEKVKALLLAILTLGLGRSNKYNKETFKSFSEMVKNEEVKEKNHEVSL